MTASRRLAAAGLLAAAFLLGGCDRAQTDAEPIRPVLSQVVAIGPYWRDANYSGDVRARHQTALGFRISGKIIERLAEVGDTVQAGQLLARLDPEDYRLRLMNAQAGLAAAQAEKNKAEADLKRYSILLRKKLISEADYTDYRNAYEVAKARLDQAQAELAVTRNQAEYTALRADRGGVITAVEAETDQVVGVGQTVMRMALAEEKEVVIAVPEKRLEELSRADDIHITLWADPDAAYRGKIREISPGADPVTRTYKVKVAILEPGARVQLGMTATVDVRQRLEGKVAQLPLSAVFQKDGKPAVWLVSPETGEVGLVPVAVAEYRHDVVLIRSGLRDGQRVVTAGVHKLHPGQKVRLLDTGA